MMRAAREQPRVVALRALLIACLVGAGFVAGAMASSGSGQVTRVDQPQVVDLSLVAARADLSAAETDLQQTSSALQNARARVRTLERANRRTTRALRDARRAARRARRNR